MKSAVRQLFRTPRFRLFWLATAISAVADQFYAVSLPWLVLQLSQSGLALGSVLMTAAVPRAVLMIPGGALSDKLSPASVLVLTLLARAMLFAAIAWPVSQGTAHLWQIYLFAATLGVLDAAAAPAAPTMVPRVAVGVELTSANSVMQSTTQAIGLAAPALAGLLISTAGVGAALGVSAVALGLGGAIMTLVARGTARDVAHRAASANTGQLAVPALGVVSTLEVVRGIWRDPALRAFLVLIAALSLATVGPIAVGVPSLARRFGGSVQFGVMLSASAMGTLAGTLLAGRFRRVRHRGIMLVLVNATIGLLLCLLGYVQSLPVTMALIVLMALGSGFVNIVATSSLQRDTHPAVLGRLMSTVMLASIGPTPLSFLLAGAAGDRDPGFLFVAAGIVVLVISAGAAFNRPLRLVD